jgi:hypothetical protein
MVKDVRWILRLVFAFFCGWLSGNGETKIQECAKKNKTSNRKFKINMVNSVKTVGNGERCEMDTTTCMVK